MNIYCIEYTSIETNEYENIKWFDTHLKAKRFYNRMMNNEAGNDIDHMSEIHQFYIEKLNEKSIIDFLNNCWIIK